MMGMNEGMDKGESGTPLDSIIARVKSYAKDPKLATPETLTELASELEDLKQYVDSEDSPGEPQTGDGGDSGDGGIVLKIRHMAGKMGALFLLLGFVGSAHAVDWQNYSKPNSFVSEAVYVSTRVTIHVGTGAVQLVAGPAYLHTVSIGTPTANSSLEIWDIATTTSATGALNLAKLSGAQTWQYPPFDIAVSSGLGVFCTSAVGQVCGDWVVTYRKK